MDFFDPKSFVWEDAPLSQFDYAFYTALAYVSICAMHALIYRKDPKELPMWSFLKDLVPAHNLVLCIGSLVMFCGCLKEVVQRSIEEGDASWLLCEDPATKPRGPLWFWSYIYYLSKYYELLDTGLQLVRGKYPPHYLLHSYHHAGVIFMGWIWVETCASMQFVGILFNTAVHVVMYYYFYLKTQNIDPSWKKYVTSLQIVQFVTSLVCFSITLYIVRGLGRECKSMRIVYGSIVFNVSLLFGFFKVFFTPNKKKAHLIKSKEPISKLNGAKFTEKGNKEIAFDQAQ